jgi:Alpha-kinase family
MHSHFSYEHSKQEELVVDIQGSGNEFTDPQLHSKLKEFGRADRGEPGFRDFFRTHKCNYICQELGLKNRSTSMSSATATTTTSSL